MTMDRVIQGTAHLGQATIQWQNVAIIAISAIIMALVYMLLEKTFVGNIMQATAQDQYMASLTGVPVIVSIGLTFALSAMITGIGGGLLAPIFFLNNTTMQGWVPTSRQKAVSKPSSNTHLHNLQSNRACKDENLSSARPFR